MFHLLLYLQWIKKYIMHKINWIYFLSKQELTLSCIAIFENENKSHLLKEDLVTDYYSTMSTINKLTADQYISRLNIFSNFLIKVWNIFTMNNLINKIKSESIDPYSVLSRYYSYLRISDISTTTIKQSRISKGFLWILWQHYKIRIKLISFYWFVLIQNIY